MSYFTQFVNGSPARVTEYTSGTGTFTPLSTTNSYARVTLVGGGGGGSASGGGASGTSVIWAKLSSASYSYTIGAGGTGGVDTTTYGGTGGTTSLGSMAQLGGGGSPTNFTGAPGSGSAADGMGLSGKNGISFGGGGDSQYGAGGASGAAGGGYGAGGGRSSPSGATAGAGSGGYILIEEFVQ